jgi:hypothetical protein
MYTRIACAVVLTALFGFMSLPARANSWQNMATFRSGDKTLLVATFTEPQAPAATGGDTVGLIAIKAGGRTLSYSFSKKDLPMLYARWNASEDINTAVFFAAGSVAEIDTKALDVLLFAGGPGVRFSIADPVDGMLVFDLARSDYAEFDSAIHQAGNALTL